MTTRFAYPNGPIAGSLQGQVNTLYCNKLAGVETGLLWRPNLARELHQQGVPPPGSKLGVLWVRPSTRIGPQDGGSLLKLVEDVGPRRPISCRGVPTSVRSRS